MIGAITRHRDVGRLGRLPARCPCVAAGRGRRSAPAVRNRGTIGGSLAHADPHADLPAALLASRAARHGAQRRGPRAIAAADSGPRLPDHVAADDELIVDVRLPDRRRPSPRTRSSTGAPIDWSIVGAAVAIRGGKVDLRHHRPRLAAGPGHRLRGGRQRRRLDRRGRRAGRRGHVADRRPRRLGRVQAAPGGRARQARAGRGTRASTDGPARRRQRTVARRTCAARRPACRRARTSTRTRTV